jgi:hypothetical protein
MGEHPGFAYSAPSIPSKLPHLTEISAVILLTQAFIKYLVGDWEEIVFKDVRDFSHSS